MRKKSAALFLVFMLGLAIIIPSLTIASSDTSPTFNVNDLNNQFSLDFSTDQSLIPGTSLSKSFIINNQKNFQIELTKITLDNIQLKKNQVSLEASHEAYNEFIKTAKFILKNNNQIIFEGLFEDLLSGKAYVPNPQVFFNPNCGDEFMGIITLLPESNNLTQSMTATFDIRYYFQGPKDVPPPPPPPWEPPTTPPKTPPTTPPPIDPPEEPEVQPPAEPPIETEIVEPEKVEEDPPEEPPEEEPEEEPPVVIIIDDEIPKMGIFFDNQVLLVLGIGLLGVGAYLLFFKKKKHNH